jgi:hypothetical protein
VFTGPDEYKWVRKRTTVKDVLIDNKIEGDILAAILNKPRLDLDSHIIQD